MPRKTLEGRTAIVTGGASGIGRSACVMLAEAGAKVAVVDLNAAGARETARAVEATGRQALALQVDVTDQDAVRAAVAQTTQALGVPLITVSNAGVAGETVQFHKETREHLWEQLAIHVGGAFNFFRETIEPMREAGWGRLVATSSCAAEVGLPGGSSYAAAKAALQGLVRTIALENTARGVTANCVLPGVIDTPILGQLSDERREKMLANNPAKRFGQPEDIAAAIAYLCSEDAGYVTGQSLSPNGGLWFS